MLSIPEVAKYVLAVMRMDGSPQVEGMQAIKRQLRVGEENSDIGDGLLNTLGNGDSRDGLEAAIRDILKQEDGVPAAALSVLLSTLCDRTEAQGLVEGLVGSASEHRMPWLLPPNVSADQVCRELRKVIGLDDTGSGKDPFPEAAQRVPKLPKRALLWLHDEQLWEHCDSNDVRQWPEPAAVPMARLLVAPVAAAAATVATVVALTAVRAAMRAAATTAAVAMVR